MPRPRPLENLTAERPYSSNYEYQTLTPRTPHSRAGRAEEAREGIDEVDYELEVIPGLGDRAYENPYGDTHQDQQHEPLLSSSASASFPHRRRTFADSERERRGKRLELSWQLILSRLPLLVGGTLALFLLFLILLSLNKPEVLEEAIGAAGPSSTDAGKVVDEDSVALSTDLDSPSPTVSSSTKTGPILSYASYTSFPLAPLEYREECYKYLASIKNPVGGYWYVPPDGPLDVPHRDEDPAYQQAKTHTHLPEMEEKRVCRSSITYMLDGFVGLTADLALMAQAAGLAREQNRTFFVNDQYWNRGKWTDHFQDVRQRQPGPEPGCLAPPPEELVACPRVARHWVINSRTALFHFGHQFMDEYEDAYARQLRRMKVIFERAAHSLTQTIRPNAENAAFIRSARLELDTALPPASPRDVSDGGMDPGSYVAVHIRRGDRKSESWAHRDSYVPTENFVRAASDVWARLGAPSADADASAPVLWLASDAPDARAEFGALLPEANASRVLSLDRSASPELRALASGAAYVQSEFDELPYDERVRLTRGALVDFAMLSGAWAWENEVRPMAAVCTISSNYCKLAAVGLGWDKAFGFDDSVPKGDQQMGIDNERKHWVEIDNNGGIAPVWRALEMF